MRTGARQLISAFRMDAATVRHEHIHFVLTEAASQNLSTECHITRHTVSKTLFCSMDVRKDCLCFLECID